MYWNVFIGFYDEEGFKMTQPTEMGIWMGWMGVTLWYFNVANWKIFILKETSSNSMGNVPQRY